MPATAQTGDERVAFMQRLMRAAFPALHQATGNVVITMSTSIGLQWDVPSQMLVDVYSDNKQWQSQDPDHRYLRGDFHFVGDAFEMASFSGEAVNQGKRDEFDRLQSAKPVSNDQELSRVLSKLDAKFGSDKRSEFTAQLDLPRFARVLGTIKEQRVDFDSGIQADPSYNRPPRWRLRLRTLDAGRTRCFVLLFEPYGGQVQAVLEPQSASPDACGGL